MSLKDQRHATSWGSAFETDAAGGLISQLLAITHEATLSLNIFVQSSDLKYLIYLHIPDFLNVRRSTNAAFDEKKIVNDY